MQFYKHHLGDYAGATTHLSWDEDMAYSRLLRSYYMREAPIPDADKYRLIRAVGKSQRAAVDVVLAEFFNLEADGWHNKRCDEEIAAYRAQASTNKRIAQQRERERIKKERERLVNETSNDSCDGLPLISTNESLNESCNEPLNNEKHDSLRLREPNQEPRTKNQEPEESKSKTKPKGANGKRQDEPPPELPDWLPLTQWNAWITARTKVRHPPTNFALRLAIAKLENYKDQGQNIAAILANAAMHNWSDLYPEQSNGFSH